MSTRWGRIERDVVTVDGPDAASYLQSQVSQELRDVDVGQSRWTLLLAPNGHVEVLARVWRAGDERFVLDTEAGFGDVLEQRVRKFMIRVKAEVETAGGDAFGELDAGSDGPLPDGAVVGWWGRGTTWLTVDGDEPPAVDGAIVGADEVEIARIRAGWPQMGAEIEPGERLPAELGIASAAVSFTKGCYPGQELVERMESRGAQAPRSLRRLTVAAGARPGDPVTGPDGAEVGTLTSVAGEDALGFVKRGAEVGEPVGSPATG